MRALVIDLNNFSRYPTLPVGLLVAVLRSAGIDVEVLSPLARGVQGYPRLTRAKPWGLIDSRLRYWSAVSPSKTVRALRECAARAVHPGSGDDRDVIIGYARELLQRTATDVVLVSAYTMYEDITAGIAGLCRSCGVPVLVGGSYLVAPQIVERWLRIDGVTGDLQRRARVRSRSARASGSRWPGPVAIPGRIGAGSVTRDACVATLGARSLAVRRLQRFSVGQIPEPHRPDHDGSRLPVGTLPVLCRCRDRGWAHVQVTVAGQRARRDPPPGRAAFDIAVRVPGPQAQLGSRRLARRDQRTARRRGGCRLDRIRAHRHPGRSRAVEKRPVGCAPCRTGAHHDRPRDRKCPSAQGDGQGHEPGAHTRVHPRCGECGDQCAADDDHRLPR